jgi:hypothetical protein
LCEEHYQASFNKKKAPKEAEAESAPAEGAE